MTKEESNEALLSAAEAGDVEALKAALAAGAEGRYQAALITPCKF